MSDNFRIALFVLVVCALHPLNGFADTKQNPILIVSSYNPDVHSTSTNISDFIDEFNKLGGNNYILIENMNCISFSESIYWRERMKQILVKYSIENKPALIVLLGQEAWASYFSQKDSLLMDVPVVAAMASRNAIMLPDKNKDSLDVWMPEPIDYISDPLNRRLRGGLIYQYDVASNVDLIRKLCPDTKHIALITDNSYGGVAMQAYIRKEMLHYPDLNLILLDGRVNTIYTILDRLRELPPYSVILIGSWRIDKNDGYFVRNATYAMMEAVPHVPAFSIASVGMGYWGCLPDVSASR